MKVLMSAYACEPGTGSEPGAGWAWTRAAALNNEVWVLTRENNRESIETALKAEPALDLHPVYLDLPKWARWWKKGHRGARLYYILWQAVVRKRAKALHAEHQFDVAHHITFAVDSLPAGVVGIRGLPAIWGPVGGVAPFLWPLVRWLGVRGFVQEVVRSVVSGITRRMFGDRAARGSALVIAQNREVASRFSSAAVVLEPNVALDIDSIPKRRSEATGVGGERMVFVGRLVPLKGALIAIALLAEHEAASWRLVIVGDGPDRCRLERWSKRIGVDARVTFLGQVSRHQVFCELSQADILVVPSLHDSASWALAEAVATGLPALALDVCGPPVIIERTGGGRVFKPDRTVLRAMAGALDCEPAVLGVEAVSAARLPDLLRTWYEFARVQE